MVFKAERKKLWLCPLLEATLKVPVVYVINYIWKLCWNAVENLRRSYQNSKSVWSTCIWETQFKSKVIGKSRYTQSGWIVGPPTILEDRYCKSPRRSGSSLLIAWTFSSFSSLEFHSGKDMSVPCQWLVVLPWHFPAGFSPTFTQPKLNSHNCASEALKQTSFSSSSSSTEMDGLPINLTFIDCFLQLN